MNSSKYIESLKSFKALSLSDSKNSDCLIPDFGSGKLIILQLDGGSLMHISPKAFFNFKTKEMQEIKHEKENQDPEPDPI